MTPGEEAVAAKMVTPQQLKNEKKAHGRLCGDLTKFLLHRSSIKFTKHKLTCAYCGGKCYSKCVVCNLLCHNNPARGDYKGYECFTKLHSNAQFGLAQLDYLLR